MQLGCGVYEPTVRGRPYLTFWHYETRGGSRRQVTEYLGPAGSARAREIRRLREATLASLKARWPIHGPRRDRASYP